LFIGGIEYSSQVDLIIVRWCIWV